VLVRYGNVLKYNPTAMHSVLDGHETPVSSLVLDGFGVRSASHRPPVQRSAKFTPYPVVLIPPTAVQTLLDAHDTLMRTSDAALAELGVRGISLAEPGPAPARPTTSTTHPNTQ
jgi:hypothetical protein